jgi:integrase
MGFFNPFTEPLEDTMPQPRGREAMKWISYKELYLDRMETRAVASSEYPQNARKVLDRFTKYCGLLERSLDQITNLDIEKYVALRRKDSFHKRPLSNRTLNNEIDLLNAAFSFAGPVEPRGKGRKYLGLLTKVPYAESLRELISTPVSLEPPQIQRFLMAVAAHATSPRYKGVDRVAFWAVTAILMLVTGLRRRGLLLIPRPNDHILVEQRQIILPATLSKPGIEQRISLGSKTVASIVATMPTQPGEPLLPWRDVDGSPMSLKHFTHTLCLIQRRAGIADVDRVRAKDFRSTGRDRQAEAGPQPQLEHAQSALQGQAGLEAGRRRQRSPGGHDPAAGRAAPQKGRATEALHRGVRVTTWRRS